ncbi:hypothetical protein FDP41_000710 [Naegleria fowleri]|uniref:Myb-like domain-containing protein n=1 Tax=Naegleria fowleri TaxID=5763 RepID=A0A6A5CC08_NAEFO|nr:uncharacterized protein FDP41_000710 [Naegleria fowleri]KAF0984811.1 hypothetical protein FDP41_000710 [Naegleria fowleri]
MKPHEEKEDTDFIPMANTIILEYLLEYCGSVSEVLLKEIKTNYVGQDVFIRVRLLALQFKELPDILNNDESKFDQRLNTLMKSLRDLLSEINDQDFRNKFFVLASFDKKPFQSKLDKWEKKLKSSLNSTQKQAALEGLINNVDKLCSCLPQPVRMIELLKSGSSTMTQQLRSQFRKDSSTVSSSKVSTIQQTSNDNSTADTTRQSVTTPKKKLKQTVLTPFTPQQQVEATIEKVTISQHSKSQISSAGMENEEMDTACGMSGFERSNSTDYNEFILNRTKKKQDTKYTTLVKVLEEELENNEMLDEECSTEGDPESDDAVIVESSEEEAKKRPRRTRKPKKEKLNPSIARSIIRESASTPKKPNRFWTELEVKALESGYKEFGNDWERILVEYREIFHESRNPSALKERFIRALAPKFKEKYGHVEL